MPTVREYRLQLTLDPGHLRFTGHVAIDLDVGDEPVRLHAAGLEISAAACGGRPLSVHLVPEAEEVHLAGAPPGAATVEVSFRGAIPERSLMGLYRSRFGAATILTTQCGPTGARHIFPCVDRPDRKAPIALSATVPEDLEVVSNTPVAGETREGTAKTVEFARTPPMATYLFYLGVGRFETVHRTAPDGVRLSVLAPAGRGAEGSYALERAAALLPAFERYYGLPYPLPKLDLIAVPEYAYGAMENWGAIVFRDMRLLVTGATGSRQRRFTLDTIAHEIAHQWFGNLVTMQWWTDIWLNESFATWMELRIVEELWPGEGSLENFLAYWMEMALLTDSLSCTRPITTPIARPDQIAQVFDEITYGKGASVLRMVEGYLGTEVFRRGVRDYLERFRYANARSGDLWEALDRAAGEPIRALLEAWVDRPGLPLLEAHLRADGIEVAQRRFHIDGRHAPDTWPIPVVAEVNGVTRRWRIERAQEHLSFGAPIRSFHLNPGALGFYRVLYDDAGYDALRRGFAERPGADQWIVLQDLYAFLFSGDASFERYATFVDAAAASREYLPARAATEQLLGLFFLVPQHPRVSALARAFLRAQSDRLGPRRRPGEGETEGILRERVAVARVWLDPEYARRLAEGARDLAGVDADLRGAIEIASARTGGAAAHAALRAALAATPGEGEAAELELALAASTEPSLIAATLAEARTGTINRAHLPGIVRQAAQSPAGRTVVWEFLRDYLDEIATTTRGTGFASYLLEYALPWVGLGREGEVRAFFEGREIPEGGRGLQKGLALLAAASGLAARL